MLHLLLVPLLLLAVAPPAVVCEDACVVPGGFVGGFVPPLLVVRSGAEVAWEGLDSVAHINLEGGVLVEDPSCIEVVYAGPVRGAARFRLEAGGLVAEQDGVARACVSAQSLPDGSALLTYQCVLHAVTMKGALVVVP